MSFYGIHTTVTIAGRVLNLHPIRGKTNWVYATKTTPIYLTAIIAFWTCSETHLIVELEVGVHFDGLPAAQTVLIDALQKIGVLLHVPHTVPVNRLHLQRQLIPRDSKIIQRYCYKQFYIPYILACKWDFWEWQIMWKLRFRLKGTAYIKIFFTTPKSLTFGVVQ